MPLRVLAPNRFGGLFVGALDELAMRVAAGRGVAGGGSKRESGNGDRNRTKHLSSPSRESACITYVSSFAEETDFLDCAGCPKQRVPRGAPGRCDRQDRSTARLDIRRFPRKVDRIGMIRRIAANSLTSTIPADVDVIARSFHSPDIEQSGRLELIDLPFAYTRGGQVRTTG